MNAVQIVEKYKIEFENSDFIKVVTHNSFSTSNNSRLVFLGQFGFKGAVAHWIGKNISGTGTQLQHFLCNILSQTNLEKYFDKVNFKNIHISDAVDITTQKHIFVYAFLGLILENSNKKQLERFIFNEFILPNNHLLPQTYIHKNQWAQLKFLCKQNFEIVPKVKVEDLEDKTTKISVFLKNEELAAYSSVSYKYARKKAIALSLKIIASKLQTQMENVTNKMKW